MALEYMGILCIFSAASFTLDVHEYQQTCPQPSCTLASRFSQNLSLRLSSSVRLSRRVPNLEVSVLYSLALMVTRKAVPVLHFGTSLLPP